jgi:hypothetical protein
LQLDIPTMISMSCLKKKTVHLKIPNFAWNQKHG